MAEHVDLRRERKEMCRSWHYFNVSFFFLVEMYRESDWFIIIISIMALIMYSYLCRHAVPWEHSFYVCVWWFWIRKYALFLPWHNPLSGPRSSHFRGFLITLRHTTLGRTPLDEWSARLRDLYLTTHNTHKKQTSMYWRDSNPQSQQASGRGPTP
jgi:hypothetical protein